MPGGLLRRNLTRSGDKGVSLEVHVTSAAQPATPPAPRLHPRSRLGAGLLAAAAALLTACAGSAPAPRSAPATRPAVVAERPSALTPAERTAAARRISSDHFYRGKALVLSGDADCARLEFRDALESFRVASRAGDPEDLEFAQRLYESVSLYERLAEGDGAEAATGEAGHDGLIAQAPDSSPDEVAAAEREVADAGAGVTFDVPIVVNDAVLRAVAYYQFRTPQAFAGALQRSGRYLPMMRAILKEKGLPEDLVYVAMIESAFKPRAHSRAAAHGFWQFISPTARRYGLEMNGDVDERSDPVKSTYAAAAYFRDLYEMFGDWQLAMAGYSCGEGRVLKGLQRSGGRTYWDLAEGGFLPRETRDYVPFFTAAALIAKSPARYGFDVVPDPPVAFDVVRVPRRADLGRIAEALGTTVDTLRELNGELRGRTTPRAAGGYPLRVPPGLGPVLTARLESIPEAPAVVERTVRIRRTESVARVAKRYRIPVRDLADWNNLRHDSLVRKGTVIVIPVRVAGPARKPKTAPVPARPAAPPESVLAQAPRPGSGEVRALPTPAAAVSDPVALVARYPAPDPAASAAAAIPVRLEIPAGGFVDEAPPAPSAQVRPSASASGAVRRAKVSKRPSAKPVRTHTVRRGDTLYSIASRYGTSVDAIRHENRIGRREPLRIGRRLTVPAHAAGR